MRILLIRFSSLGDVVLATAIVSSLRRTFPDSEITVTTKDEYRSLFDCFDPPIHVVPYNSSQSFSNYLERFESRTFDYVVDLHRTLRSRRLLVSLKARHVGRVRKHWIRRQKMVRYKRGLNRPLRRLSMYYDAASKAGLSLHESFPLVPLSEVEIQKANSLLDGSDPAIGIGWGARWATKAVPVELWKSLIVRLAASPCHFVLFGQESDRESMDRMISETNLRDRAMIVIEDNLREVMVRLVTCRVFLSSDSGLMHLAAALGVPTIGLFGPTHPALGFAPVGENSTAFHAGTYCSPCHQHGRKPCIRDRRYCFEELNLVDIAGMARRMMNLQIEATTHE